MVYNRIPGVNAEYEFPPQIRQTLASSTEMSAAMQTTINAKVPAAVAEEISKDTTIIQAAENAVEGVVGDRLDEIESQIYDDPTRFLRINHSVYSMVWLSKDYRIIGGVLNTGGIVGVTPDKLETVSPASTGGLVELSFDYRRAQPMSDTTGKTPQHVLNEWATRLPSESATTSLLSVGDSMTTDYGNLGVSVASALAKELDLTPYDRGYSGMTSLQIAWKMGVAGVRLTTSLDVIPASGTIGATITPSIGWYRGYTFDSYVMDANGVNRRVRIVQSTSSGPNVTPTWTIEVTDGLGSAKILSGSRVVPETGVETIALQNPMVLWTGRNDANLERVVAYTKMFLENHRDSKNRIMVRPIFNTSGEPAGSSGYANIMNINSALSDLAGSRYYDDRSALIKHGLSIRNLSPTEADLVAISEDRIPPSLMLDGTHLNADGRLALARIDAIEIKNRNWFI